MVAFSLDVFIFGFLTAKKQDETPEWAKKRQHKLIKQASRDGPTEIERFEASYLQSQGQIMWPYL